MSQRGTGAFVALVVIALCCAMGWTRPSKRADASRTWRPDYLGVSLEAPVGWSELRPGGAWCLVRDPADVLAGFVHVEVEPDPYRCDAAQWLRGLRASFELGATRAIDRWDVSDVAGLQVAHIDWHGTPVGAAAPMRGTLVACDRGDSHVLVEVLARADAWPALEHDVEQLLAMLTIEQR